MDGRSVPRLRNSDIAHMEQGASVLQLLYSIRMHHLNGLVQHSKVDAACPSGIRQS